MRTGPYRLYGEPSSPRPDLGHSQGAHDTWGGVGDGEPGVGLSLCSLLPRVPDETVGRCAASPSVPESPESVLRVPPRVIAQRFPSGFGREWMLRAEEEEKEEVEEEEEEKKMMMMRRGRRAAAAAIATAAATRHGHGPPGWWTRA
ncbi:unnamed protein product [Merluccius merluccius]